MLSACNVPLGASGKVLEVYWSAEPNVAEIVLAFDDPILRPRGVDRGSRYANQFIAIHCEREVRGE